MLYFLISMTTPRIISRVMVVHDDKILLVRNRGAKFWYPPGGGWEFDQESLADCAVREVAEETGYKVVVKDLVWVREFREDEKIFLETFWRATLADDNEQTFETLKDHIDLDENGAVEEAHWFTEAELEDIKVLPPIVKTFASIGSEPTETFLGQSIA